MLPDPTIARVREARHRISERFGHDPKRLVEYYMKLQEQDEFRGRLIRSTEMTQTCEDEEEKAV
jgi:hypothetical protein